MILKMGKLAFNNLEERVVSWEVVECFQDISGKKKMIVKTAGEFQYVGIIKNAKLEIEVEIQSWEVKGNFNFLVPVGQEKSMIHLKNTIEHSDVDIEIKLISLQKEGANLDLDGVIQINPQIKNVSASLLEEVYLLGNTLKSQVKPALFVASHEVKTSHGTKIQRIPKESLFYLQSRGLTHQRAKDFFMENIVEKILSPVSLSDTEKNQIFTLL